MSDVSAVRASVERAQRRVDQELGELRALARRGKELTREVEEVERETQEYEQAATLLTTLAEQSQEQAQRTIEGLVTQGLQTVFGPSLSFHLVSSARGRAQRVDFLVRSHLPDGPVDTPVRDARGGGLSAVTGFLLRLVVILLSPETKVRRLLVLDETFAHLSEEYRSSVAQVLREVVAMGVQIVMVTHHDEFAEVADRCYRLSLDGDGHTRVARVGS